MSEFQHSVKVPRLYKDASKILKSVHQGGSLKSLVFNHNRFSNIKGLHALVAESLKHDNVLSKILYSTEILSKEKFDPWLAKILLTELIFGKKRLPGNSKPVVTLLKYKEDIDGFLDSAGILPLSLNNVLQKKKGLKPRYVRINTLKISLEDALEKFKGEGWEEIPCPNTYDEFLLLLKNNFSNQDYVFIQDYHVKNLLVFPSSATFYDHNAYLNGYIVLQDKASCLLTCCTSITSGSVILDMCAAPGMKTTLLASCIDNNGKIFAIEQNYRRFSMMKNLLHQYGVTCAILGNGDAGSVGPNICKDVKYILVDPSCSGTGMTSRIEDVEVSRNLKTISNKLRLQRLANVQGYLLRHALSNFPTAKYVFYSTCSLQEEENEVVVESVLGCAKLHGFSLVNLKKKINGWKNFGSDKYNCGKKCIYSKPDLDYTNGGFLAVFKRKSKNVIIVEDNLKTKCLNISNENAEKKIVKLSEQFFALVNTLKISVDNAIQQFVDIGWKHLPSPMNYNIFLNGLKDDERRAKEKFFEQDYHIKELLLFPYGIVDELSESFIKDRKFVLLDKVSCLAVHLLDPKPGDVVLDLCAGTEKMALFIASRMNNDGLLYAYEPSYQLHNELKKELNLCNISCKITHDSGYYSNATDCPNVKLVLVCPPCSVSGSGFLYKTQNALAKNTNEDSSKIYILKNFTVSQFSLLRHAFSEFPEAYRVVYVTRSVHPEENEDIVNALLVLGKFNGFELIDATSRIDGWKNECITSYYWAKNCIVMRDESSITKGFFIAVFERNCKNRNNLVDVNLNFDNDIIFLESDDDKNTENKKRKYDSLQLNRKLDSQSSDYINLSEGDDQNMNNNISSVEKGKIDSISLDKFSVDDYNSLVPKKSKKKKRTKNRDYDSTICEIEESCNSFVNESKDSFECGDRQPEKISNLNIVTNKVSKASNIVSEIIRDDSMEYDKSCINQINHQLPYTTDEVTSNDNIEIRLPSMLKKKKKKNKKEKDFCEDFTLEGSKKQRNNHSFQKENTKCTSVIGDVSYLDVQCEEDNFNVISKDDTNHKKKKKKKNKEKL